MIGFPIHKTLSAAALLAAAPFAVAQQAPAGLEELANHALGLERSQVLQVVDPDLAQPYDVGALIDGRPVILQLQPANVLAEGFRLLEQGPDGSITQVPAQPSSTLRGTLLGHPGSQVAASLLGDGLHARILVDSGEFWIEPLARAVPTAGAGAHVLYSTNNVIKNVGVCGMESLANAKPANFGAASGYGAGGQIAATAGYVAELACDADYEYFLDYGSTGAVQNRITTVINTMNLQYEAEVDISHTITAILVRTSSNQPYTSTDAGTLLNQFRSEWNANQGSIQRDIAQLFTGKEINSSTIGIAWLGVICNSSYGYSMVQSDFNGNFASATDLSAHELGHNWNADHCSCTSFTMNAFITTANTFSPNFTVPDITSFRNSVGCLDTGPPVAAEELVVASIAKSTVKVSKGNKAARVTVVITDDTGAPEAGATVTVTITGGVNETLSGTTNSNGSVTLTTSQTKKGKLNFTACVDSVSGSLPYNPSGQDCN